MQLTFDIPKLYTHADWDAIQKQHTERLKRAPSETRTVIAQWKQVCPQFAHLSLRDLLDLRHLYEYRIDMRGKVRAPIFLEECLALQKLCISRDTRFIAFLEKETLR